MHMLQWNALCYSIISLSYSDVVISFQTNSHQNSKRGINMCVASRQLIGRGRQEHQSQDDTKKVGSVI